MIQVLGVSTFTDNYVWLITNEARQHAVIVDPGNADPVIDEIEQRQLTPTAILITHHHQDVIGGVGKLLETYPGLVIYSPDHESIPYPHHTVSDTQTIKINEPELEFEVLEIPGHTAEHVAYYGEDSLFSGDTLLGNGCGKVFDSSIEELHTSLHRIAQLPVESLVYCTHEYTVENLGFAKWVEPDNQDIEKRFEASRELLDSGRATVPFTLEDEFKSNPFLRTHIPEVIRRIEEVAGRELQTPDEVFAAMHIWKDTEYG